MGRLDSQVAIVTGGTRGLGAAAARLFSQEGATVVVTGTQVDLGRAIAQEIGGGGMFIEQDVADADAWARVADEVKRRYGRCDVLLNNAGIVKTGPITGSVGPYLDVVDVNQHGVLFGIHAIAPMMVEQGKGSIVNTASIGGFASGPDVVGYTASKFAVRGITRAAAIELGPFGVRVNALCPGYVKVRLGGEESARPRVTDVEAYARMHPLGRAGEASEIAQAALFLASDDSSFVTGTDLVVDGGFLAQAYTPTMDTPDL